MKMKVIYDDSTNIENQSNDKVLINMSYEEFLNLRIALLTANEESCLDLYNKLIEAREKAKTEWK